MASNRVCKIGGQALLEGVMMRGEKSMAIAVRSESGEILLETTRIKPKGRWGKVPIIRGVISFLTSLALGVTTTMKSAEFLDAGEEKPLSKGWVVLSVVLGLVLGVAGFMLLPTVVSDLLSGWLGFKSNVLLRSLISGTIRIILFVLYLLLVSKIKDIKRVFMYHGAEHRTIACYEAEKELSVANVQTFSTKHDRCGTTFLFIVMVVSIVVYAFTSYLTQMWGVPDKMYYNLPIRLAMLPLVAGVSYEVLFLVAKLPNNAFVRILKAPGLSLQALTTKKPLDDMAEVAITAFNAVLLMDADPSLEVIDKTKYYLAMLESDVDSILLGSNIYNGQSEEDFVAQHSADKDFILAHALNCGRKEYSSIKVVGFKARRMAIKMAKRRAQGMSLGLALGSVPFYYTNVKINSKVLAPRNETELLVEQALKHINEGSRVLDLCTGSGCIALAIATSQPNCEVVASDISPEALEVAKSNLSGTSVKVVQGDMFEAVEGRFDVIVCNPPYVKTADIAGLDQSVKGFEPTIALDGGEDGLNFYRTISNNVAQYLKENGVLLLEIGFDQADAVREILSAFSVEVLQDYAGLDRIVIARII